MRVAIQLRLNAKKATGTSTGKGGAEGTQNRKQYFDDDLLGRKKCIQDTTANKAQKLSHRRRFSFGTHITIQAVFIAELSFLSGKFIESLQC
ncbi:predicted protein [Histoplasma mississippiense (nom. inval.)]|uniref:predicted protein n=1 Tax=Ajellomyces capsulatus (strain NAm1 / WU24) TaxID=2059318 RepID=UPI000157C1EC|nr:predicted protein [Histoplasma mississippiense (nom. inval.)]EDN07824.1 predicted protein [Histoplasma mississippiense (nom. inval.)]